MKNRKKKKHSQHAHNKFIMRAITTIFAALLIVAVCTGCAARRTAGISTRLFGTWEMTSVLRNDRVEYITDSHLLTHLKIMNNTHFVTVHYNAGGTIARINGGTYTLSRFRYIENPTFSSHHNPPVVNAWIVYGIRFRGSDEFQMDGRLANGFRVLEEWRRVETRNEHPPANTITPNPLVGTWIMYISDDASNEFRKIINETHFVTVIYSREGQVLFADGGTYTLDGDVFIKHYAFSSHGIGDRADVEYTISFRGNNEFQIVRTWVTPLGVEVVETTVYRRVGSRR